MDTIHVWVNREGPAYSHTQKVVFRNNSNIRKGNDDKENPLYLGFSSYSTHKLKGAGSNERPDDTSPKSMT